LSHREILKIQLIFSRAEYFPGKGLLPRCPVCAQPIHYPKYLHPDLHEVILTRGKVQGAMKPEEALKLISHPCNCVLRHHVCPDGKNYHTSGTGGDEVFEKCVRQIVKYEGYDHVMEWLMEMKKHFPVAAEEARLRVRSVFE